MTKKEEETLFSQFAVSRWFDPIFLISRLFSFGFARRDFIPNCDYLVRSLVRVWNLTVEKSRLSHRTDVTSEILVRARKTYAAYISRRFEVNPACTTIERSKSKIHKTTGFKLIWLFEPLIFLQNWASSVNFTVSRITTCKLNLKLRMHFWSLKKLNLLLVTKILRPRRSHCDFFFQSYDRSKFVLFLSNHKSTRVGHDPKKVFFGSWPTRFFTP